jgi:hypothetical protein
MSTFLRSSGLKLLRRILVTIIVSLAVLFVGLYWVAPVALSFYAARKAPQVTRVVPQPLKDTSVSRAPTTTLSYFGYEFALPWTDFDGTLTKLYPKDNPAKNRADLHFHSGLRIVVTAVRPGEWTRGLEQEMKLSTQEIDSVFGRDVAQSDYRFVKSLYEFTPERMNHWTVSSPSQSRDQTLLIIKSLALLKSAESGIFVLNNPNYPGFQEGSPLVRQDGIAIHLFSDDGSVEMLFFQKDYKSLTGVTQPEINRIVESLRKASPTNLVNTPGSLPESRSDARD